MQLFVQTFKKTILGLDFLVRNKIVVDAELQTVIA